MAIFHLNAKIVGRGGGKSAVAASAYRAACKLTETIIDPETGISFDVVHDYSKKKGLVYSKILTPDFTPAWVNDREKLWNNIQNIFDIRSVSQFAKDITIALPAELSVEQNIKLLEEFVHETFVKEGMIADLNFHNDNPENPHAHILLTTREIIKNDKVNTKYLSSRIQSDTLVSEDEYTFGSKVEYWKSKEFLVHTRRMWAGYVNKHLEMHGIVQEVSHLSHKERGIDLTPGIKVGAAHHIHGAERASINKEIALDNEERIKLNPELVLDKYRKNKVVFTKEDIAKDLFTIFATEFTCESNKSDHENVSVSVTNVPEDSIAINQSGSKLHKDKQLNFDNVQIDPIAKSEKRAKATFKDDSFLEIEGQKSFAEYIIALDKVMGSDKLVMLPDRSLDGKKLYTLKIRYDLEKDFIDTLVGIKKADKDWKDDRPGLIPSKHSLSLEDKDLDKKSFVEKAVEKTQELAKEYLGFDYDKIDLSKQQRKVALEVLNGKSVNVIEGLPGTGKTTLMREVVRQYKKAGYDVLGVAVSSSAARELGFAANIKALSITKFRYLTENLSYKEFRKKGSLTMDYYKEVNPLKANILSNKQLVIVDESSMVDLTEMHYIFKEVEKLGAKLIILGDSNQLPAIGSMGAAEKVAEIYGVSRLDEVRRQSNVKHREATSLLSRFKIEEAIKLYRETDTFRFSRTHQIAKDQLVKDYVAKYLDIYNANSKDLGKDLGKDVLGANSKDNQNLQGQKQHQHQYEHQHQHQHKHKEHDLISSKIVALSYTNEDIAYLNKEIRSRLIDNGVISGSSTTNAAKTFNINNGGERKTIELAKGDQIVFTKNDNYLGVVNSDIGEVVGFGMAGNLLVRLQNDSRSGSLLDSVASSIFGGSGRIIEIDSTKFNGFDYGYAKSVHKTQGKTFDYVLGMFDEHIGYFIFNVMATRHRESLKIYVGDEILNEELYRKISLDPSNAKLDYKIRINNNDPESHRYASLVALVQKRVDTSLAVDYIRAENELNLENDLRAIQTQKKDEHKEHRQKESGQKEESDFKASKVSEGLDLRKEVQKEALRKTPSQILREYIDIKNEVIKIRQAVDSWLSLERLKGRVHHYNDHPYTNELKEKLAFREDLACHIIDNYGEFKRLLTQYKINYNTIQRQSGRAEYKNSFIKNEFNGDVRDIDGFKTILDEQSKLSKFGQIQYGQIQHGPSPAVSPLFAKAVEESRKIIHETSSNLLSEIEEHRLSIFKCQKELEDARFEKDKAIGYIEDGNNFINKGIQRSLHKIYKDEPSKVLERWDGLQKERGLEYALKAIHKDPEILGKMNGVGLLGISITSSRAEAQENASTLDKKLKQYEEYKKTIPELEDKLTQGLKTEISSYDASILQKEVELKNQEAKLPSYAIREFIKSSYQASKDTKYDVTKDQDQASRILSWAKDEKTAYECDQYREIFAQKERHNQQIQQIQHIQKMHKIHNERSKSQEVSGEGKTQISEPKSKFNKSIMREDIGSKDYLRNRDACLERYEYSNGRDDRSKLCRNIAGSVQPDLAYSILRDFSFRSISQSKGQDRGQDRGQNKDGDKAVFLVDINVYEQYQEKELDRVKDSMLMSARHAISYDIKEVEILPYEANTKNLKNIENVRNIYQVNNQQMSDLDERCIRRVIEDELFDAKDSKDSKNLTFTAGDHLSLEIDTHKIFNIIMNTRRNAGEELESYVEREEILAAKEIYQERDKRAGILLKENEHARSLEKHNPLAAKIFCENLVDLHMSKGTSSSPAQKEGHIHEPNAAKGSTVNFSSLLANELPLNKIQIEQQKLIAVEQAEIIKAQRDMAINMDHSNHSNHSNQSKPANHINQANQANHINKLYKNEKIFTKSLIAEDQKAREEYIKFGSNKVLEANLLSNNRVKLDVAKVQEITNSVVHKADETLFRLQKQYKIERQQEMQQDRQRQMSRGMER